jgi:hypothetical protein
MVHCLIAKIMLPPPPLIIFGAYLSLFLIDLFLANFLHGYILCSHSLGGIKSYNVNKEYDYVYTVYE